LTDGRIVCGVMHIMQKHIRITNLIRHAVLKINIGAFFQLLKKGVPAYTKRLPVGTHLKVFLPMCEITSRMLFGHLRIWVLLPYREIL